jgi:hypothetical protein
MGKKIGREYALAPTAMLARAIAAASPMPKISRRMEKDLRRRLAQRQQKLEELMLMAPAYPHRRKQCPLLFPAVVMTPPS